MGMSCSAWKEVELGDVCSKIGSGSTPTGGANAYCESGISLIRSQNILDFKFSDIGLAYINEIQAKKLNIVTIEEGDVLLNITGDSVARSCIVPKDILPARVNQHVSIIRGLQNSVDNRYILYYLQNNKTYLLSIAGTGGTRNALTKKMIENLNIKLPPFHEQKLIADTLSCLDDKIELNNRINKTLEEMAQAIFKSWFVDFEPFQDCEFEDSELGRIPKGWRVGRFTEIAEVCGGGTPRTNITAYWNGDIPFFTPKDCTSSYYAMDTEKHITIEGLQHCNSKLYSKDTVFVTARGTVGKVNMAICNMAMNQSCYALKGFDGYSQYFIHQLTINLINKLKHKASGAVFDAIITRDFDSEFVCIPTRESLILYNECIKPLYSLIERNQIESQILVLTRDPLLPKLMSGEIRVPIEEVQ